MDQVRKLGAQALFVQRAQNLAARSHAFRNLAAQVALDQRRGFLVQQVVELGHPQAAYLEDVPEAFGREEARARPPLLEDGVRRDGRAVQDGADLGGRQRLLAREVGQRGHDAAGIVGRSRGDFAAEDAAVAADGHDVREGAADVHSDAHVDPRRLVVRRVSAAPI